MKTLQKRSVAVPIAAALVLISFFFGTWRSLNGAAKDLEENFYTGVYLKDEGYLEASIDDHLNERLQAANGILSVGGQYEEFSAGTETLRTARSALIEAGSIASKYAANLELEQAWQKLYADLSSVNLTADEAEALSHYASALSGAQRAIENSHYNQQIDTFYSETLAAFPANILHTLLLSDTPDYFGEEG